MGNIDETKIKNIPAPKQTDFKSWNEYHQKRCEYLIEKYKETYVKE